MMNINVKEIIQKHNLLKKGDHVIVGVSGGPDSVCLLHVLFLVKKEYQLTLSVVHINHMLRGKDADADEAYVKELCKEMNLPFYPYRIDVRAMTKALSTSEEEAGRKARYDAFFEVLRNKKANKIAVAQNMNDQAETLLMRLARGSGLDGLSGIDYMREGVVIRPLLDTSREDIEAYCKAHNLKPRIDQTNLKPIYTRNKIRLELIPYLAENFNKKIVPNLWKTAKILKEDKDFIYFFADEAYEKCCKKKTEYRIDIEKIAFNELHIAIKKRVILRTLKDLGVEKDIGTVHLDNMINIIKDNKTSVGMDLPYDLRIEIGYDNIHITNKKEKNICQRFCYEIEWGKNIQIKELNAVISSEVLLNKGQEISKIDHIKYFDYDKLNGPLMVRTRRAGDRFSPLGMKGSKKLKDFFIDEKIPKKDRDHIPLVCCGSEVLWIIGYRINDKFKVDAETKRIVILEYIL